MTLSDKEISRLFMIRKIVKQMLKDRGYELEMTRVEFIAKYGENMKEGDIVIKKSKIHSSADQIYIFFPEEPIVRVKTLQMYLYRMKRENVYQAILVVQQNLTSYAQACVSEISSKFKFEVFKEAELFVNIKEHVLVPVHEVLSPEEKKTIQTIHSEGNSDLMAQKPPTIVTVEDVCIAYFGRKKALKTAVLDEFEQLYHECNREKGKLSLLAFEDGTWEVVQFGSTNSIPHPINICDPSLMSQKLWRQWVASQCDTWLHEQAMNSCTHQSQRDEVFDIILCSTTIVSLIPITSISVKKMERTNVILENLEDKDEVPEKETEISTTMGNGKGKDASNGE